VILVDHLLRSGYHVSATNLASEAGIQVGGVHIQCCWGHYHARYRVLFRFVKVASAWSPFY
jgi:hypothetical protein